MNKEEKLKEAYGEEFNEHIDSDGWMLYDNQEDMEELGINLNFDIRKDASTGSLFIRPKALQGIENNNGWIKIESEADLPKDENELFDSGLLNEGSFNQEIKRHSLKTLKWLFERKQISHYRSIEKVNPPIF